MFRKRLKQRKMARLEVHVRKDDAALIRNVIRALANPDQERATRTLLREHFGIQAQGLKALLAAAPLEGIDLRRGRDFGRKVELNYLIDTNIIFEIRKGRRCDPNVARWYEKKRGCESVS
jgi:hypothetical protein